MKILFVSNTYTPYKAGVVNSINATVAELQKEGHSVSLITLDFLGSQHKDPPWVKRIPSIFRFKYQHNHMALPWAAHAYIHDFITDFDPDVVHIHHPFLLGPIAQRVAEAHGIKTVFTYHTQYEKYAHYVPGPQLVTQPMVSALVLNFCKSVDQIIVPSAGIKEYLYAQGIMHAMVLPSAVRDDFFNQPCIQKKLAAPYQLLYVGRFTQEKNIPFLLDVMAMLPSEYSLTLVGYGAHTESLKQYGYGELKLSPNRVQFIIQPCQATLLNLYKQAHLFLFASQTDTQGLVLAESMACSTPVIALDGIGQRDIIQNGLNGYIVHSFDEMAERIQATCFNQAIYHHLQQGAYNTRMNYCGSQLVKKLLAAAYAP